MAANIFTRTSSAAANIVPPPTLVVLRQNSLAEESIVRNGIQKNVHVVVKNSPFLMQLGVRNGNGLSLSQLVWEARLFYDCDDEKEVDFIKVKPLEYKPHVSDAGEQLTMDLRIKVLTSQHEDMFFRIRIHARDPTTHHEIASLTAVSHPIKVISKPDQVRKPSAASSRKRTANDSLLDTLQRLEEQQAEQQLMLSTLLERSLLPAPVVPAIPVPVEPSTAYLTVSAEQPRLKKAKLAQPITFESSFEQILGAFDRLEAHKRPEAVRKLVRSISARDTERLAEMVDLFRAEGVAESSTTHLNTINGLPSFGLSTALGTENCGENCPHKQELVRIDAFYNDFLSSALLSS